MPVLIVLPDATNDRGFAMTSSFSSMLLAAALAFRRARHPATVDATRARRRHSHGGGASDLRSGSRRKRFERVVYLGSNELRGLAARPR